MPSRSSPPKLSSPYSAVATLLLIENSSSMLTVWHILRDRYLPAILRKLQSPNSSTLPSTFFIESSALSSALGAPPLSKVYQGSSCEIEFEHEHDATSTVSPEKIHSSIDLLTSMATKDQSLALNLIVVAASVPIVDHQNIDPNYHITGSPWLQLAERLVQENVQCHLVLKPHQDISPFEIMFEEILRMKKIREAPLPFSTEPTEAIIRLTEMTADQQFSGTVPKAGNSDRRSPLRRMLTHPLEPFNGRTNEPQCMASSQAQPETPSLVTELQQRHGLTKKKVYGTKPPRTPFFRDEPISDPYRRPGLPLSTPLTDIALPNPITLTPGGRSAPLSKLDRMSRMAHRSPTDATSRRWHSSTSKLSAAANTGFPAPAISAYTSLGETPTTPSYQQLPMPQITQFQPPVNVQYQSTPPLDENEFGNQAAYDSRVDPRWCSTANVYITQNYDLFPTYQDDYHPNATVDVYDPSQTTTSRNSPPLSQTPSIPSITSQPSQATVGASYDEPRAVKHGASTKSSSSTPSTSKATSNLKDDEPFTFGPEYIAATAVMFRQEVLPAYPEYSELAGPYGPPLPKRGNPTVARGRTAIGCDYSILPYLPASKAGHLFAAKYGVSAYQQSTPEASEMPVVTSEYTLSIMSASCLPQHPAYSMGTSSLTGWAG